MSEWIYEEASNAEMRKEYCEYCLSASPPFETHHVKSKGAGGSDIRANKINLCVWNSCHDRAQQYEIKQYELIIRIARREQVLAREIYEAINLPLPDNIDEIEELVKNEEYSPRTIEDILSILTEVEQKSNDIRFIQGELFDELYRRGIGYSWIASQIGRSAAYVRTTHHTFVAFPAPENREQALSWSHHKVAAHTEEPQKWIQQAAGKNIETGEETGEPMSVRDMRKAIEEEAVAQGEAPTEKEELKQIYKKASKVVNELQELLAQGGEPASWLREEISQLLKDLPSSEAKDGVNKNEDTETQKTENELVANY